MNKPVWVTLDRMGLVVWSAKPKFHTEQQHFRSAGTGAYICEVFFRAATGLRLKKGQCVKVRFKAEIVKE